MILKHLIVGSLQVNCYVLGSRHGGKGLVIDPGGNAGEIAGILDEEGLELKYILLTHGHVDHVGGVWELQRKGGGEVLMHRGDLPFLRDIEQHALAFGLPPTGKPSVDCYIDDGDRIEVDDFSMEVYHTPGHSPGGVSFRFNDLLFVGDTLFAGSVGRTDLAGGSFEELVRSVKEKLFPLGDETKVCPGHGPPTTIGEEKLYNPFLRDVYMA